MNDLNNLPITSIGKSGWPWVITNRQIPDEMPGNFSMPRISIVTPSYNQGQFLEETIRSVLLQGYPNLEYIIMDGGSTDNSLDIIKKYEPWLAYWASEPDGGQSQAINKGFERAAGDILGWLNSDDFYAPDVFNTVAQAMSGKKHALLVGSSVQTFTPHSLDGKSDGRKPSWEEMAYEARSFPQPSVFWTRDLWEASGGLDVDLYFAMDYDLWLRMRPRARTEINIDKIISYARTHEGQKGQVAARTGDLNTFTRQRAYAAVRAAKTRGESLFAWMLKTWEIRIRQSLAARSLYHLRGSPFHWQSTLIALRWMLSGSDPFIRDSD